MERERPILLALLLQLGFTSGTLGQAAEPASQSLFGTPEGTANPADPAAILQRILPPAQRLIVAEAPETVELVLREKGNAKVLHLVNIASGKREFDPKTPDFINLRIRELPPAPESRIALRLPVRPAKVTFEPQGQACDNWTWSDGLLNLTVPAFAVHQMVVIQ
jgi:hypothetical protein